MKYIIACTPKLTTIFSLLSINSGTFSIFLSSLIFHSSERFLVFVLTLSRFSCDAKNLEILTNINHCIYCVNIVNHILTIQRSTCFLFGLTYFHSRLSNIATPYKFMNNMSYLTTFHNFPRL